MAAPLEQGSVLAPPDAPSGGGLADAERVAHIERLLEGTEPAPDLGVLLVHGIGNHRQGETLNEFATPIVKWIDRWLVDDEELLSVGGVGQRTKTKGQVGYATFERGTLRPPDLALGIPAHARAAIKVMSPIGVVRNHQAWLFAESWWSPQTLAPKVSPFLLWLITRGPWLMLMHLSQWAGIDYQAFMAEMQRDRPLGSADWPLYRRMMAFTGITAVWLVLSLLLILLWSVVSLIALVPVGAVRQRVYRVLIAITGVVGDSYVLINDPIQRVAFANSARRALAWLEAQGCARLAVVAHSQGAAVARDVLLETGAPQVDLFLTLGPGIAKLDALSNRERSDPHSFMWAGAAAPLAFAAIALYVRLRWIGETGFASWGFPSLLGLLALIAIVQSWATVAESLGALKPAPAYVRFIRSWQPKMRWRDFHASHDPVSNGPLAASVGAGVRRMVSARVRVLSSLLDDHTSYWTSRADFVARVVVALSATARLPLFRSAANRARLRAARMAHARWVRVRVSLRWAMALSLVLPLVHADHVEQLGRSVRAAVDEVPMSSVTGFVDGFDSAAEAVASWVLARPVDGGAVTGFLLLAVAAIVVVHVWGRIVSYWWEHASSVQLTPLFRPSLDTWGPRIGRWVLMGVVVTLGALPPAMSIGWTFFNDRMSWAGVVHLLAVFGTLVLLAGYAALLTGLVLGTREAWAEARQARATGAGRWRAWSQSSTARAMLLGWLIFGAIGGWLLSRNDFILEAIGLAALLAIGAGAVTLGEHLRDRITGRRRRA